MRIIRHKTYDEVKQQCLEQRVPFREPSRPVPFVFIGDPYGGQVTYNTSNGRFFGKTDKRVEFFNDSAEHSDQPWFKALLRFFYVVEE